MQVHSETSWSTQETFMEKKKECLSNRIFLLFMFSYVSCPEETSLLESPAAAEGQGSHGLSLVKWWQ